MIRAATLGDIPRLVELLGELFSMEADFSAEPEKQSAGLKKLIDSPVAQVFVVESEGRVVGMCSVQILISTAAGKEIGSVEDVIIDADYRGKGFGSELLQALEEFATKNGLARLQLQADKDNLAAIEFYVKHGWETTHLVGLWKRDLGRVDFC